MDVFINTIMWEIGVLKHHGEFRKLGTIPPLVDVEAEEPTRLALQSSIESSSDGSLISIYLSAGSRIGIQSVDSRQDVDGQGTRFHSFPASLAFIDGSILVLRSSGVRSLQVEVGNIIPALAGAGRTILGVRSSGGLIHVDCLQGGCTYERDGGVITVLEAGQSLTVSQSSDESIELYPVLPNTKAFWDDLCAGCISTP